MGALSDFGGSKGAAVEGLVTEILDALAPSSSPGPRKFVLPSLLGLPISEARHVAHREGFRLRTRQLTTKPPPTEGRVAAQSPASGTVIRRRSEVIVDLVWD